MSGVASHGTFAPGLGERRGERTSRGDRTAALGFGPGSDRKNPAGEDTGPVRRLVCAWSIEPRAAARSARAAFAGEPGVEIAVDVDGFGVRWAGWRWIGLAGAEAHRDESRAWTPMECASSALLIDERRGLAHVRVPGLIELTASWGAGVPSVLFVRSAMLERVLAEGGVPGGRCEFVGLDERSRADSAA